MTVFHLQKATFEYALFWDDCLIEMAAIWVPNRPTSLRLVVVDDESEGSKDWIWYSKVMAITVDEISQSVFKGNYGLMGVFDGCIVGSLLT